MNAKSYINALLVKEQVDNGSRSGTAGQQDVVPIALRGIGYPDLVLADRPRLKGGAAVASSDVDGVARGEIIKERPLELSHQLQSALTREPVHLEIVVLHEVKVGVRYGPGDKQLPSTNDGVERPKAEVRDVGWYKRSVVSHSDLSIVVTEDRVGGEA